MTLDLTLKLAAILLLALSGYEFLYGSTIPLVPVIAANIIFVASVFSRNHPQRVAVIAIGLAVVIPIGALRAYARGDSTLIVALFNLPIFAHVAYVSLQTLRTGGRSGQADDATTTPE
jgi:hypothetical protein